MGEKAGERGEVGRPSLRQQRNPYWRFRERIEVWGKGSIGLGPVAEVARGSMMEEWRKDQLVVVLAAGRFVGQQLAAAVAAHFSVLLSSLGGFRVLYLGSSFRAAAVPRAAAVVETGVVGQHPPLPS